jgi:2-C-methyl-D-erythritol 4-phosphate cytidylyltransferase/2-C-methyl-D-erythritol 2,4-cyclodiphosphate synthase
VFVTAIIAAGGRGQRFGGAQPKQLIAIAGEPILARSVRAFATHPSIGEVVVALPQELVSNPPAYLRAPRIRVVAGGARRQDSVANAFAAASPASEVIVIHDAARPFASGDLIARTIAAAAESGAAVAAMASRDTVKRTDATRIVRETIPRETIYLAQTPQAFRRDVLADALRLTGDATDEAALAEQAGHAVRIVDGEPANIKITTPDDLVLAEAILRSEDREMRNQSPNQSAIRIPQSALPARTGRAGTGYDLHRLVEGRPLILAGVTIPFEHGALGHSDADVVCHAVTDAVLGALSLGDIGRHFPDTDPRWKDANSLALLERAVALAHEQGYEIGNVDVTIVLERPKIKDYVDAMRANLARALGIDAARVSVKGKTNEGVDAVGRGEAIAAHAIALARAR